MLQQDQIRHIQGVPGPSRAFRPAAPWANRMKAEARDTEPVTTGTTPAPPAGSAAPALPKQTVTRSTSALEPLVEPLFRVLWVTSVVSNIGTWMQNAGGAWLMTELTRRRCWSR
jgi:hypothetical protein